MRVLMIGPGRSVALQRPLAWALQAGYNVQLASDHNPYSQRTAKYRFLPLWGGQGPRGLRRPLAWLSQLQLRALAVRWQPDIVHAHHMGWPTLFAARAGLKPLVVSAWGALNRLLGPQATGDIIAQPVADMLAAADALVVESPLLVQRCETLLDVSFRMALIPLGMDPHRFRPQSQEARASWRCALDIPPGVRVLLSPRGWSESYGHHHILTAYALAESQLPQPAMLVFVTSPRGRSGAQAEVYLQRLQQQAAQLGVADRVRWLPELRHDLMPGLYGLADVVLNYPSEDAWPSTLVEAAACGRPIITSALPSYRHTFVESFCEQVEPERPQALAEAIVSVLRANTDALNPRLRRMRQVVVEQYDEAIAKARLFNLYRDLAAA